MTSERSRSGRGGVFHASAAVAMTLVLVAGGGLTTLIIVGGAPGSEAIVLLLKALGIAAYLVAIGLGVYLWRVGHWAVVALPILTMAVQVLIVILGNELTNWGFPIWPRQ